MNNPKLDVLLEALHNIVNELERAQKLHPDWPKDLIHQVAIQAEESGEALQAALNHVYHQDSINEVRKELIQAGAMVLRCLINLKEEVNDEK